MEWRSATRQLNIACRQCAVPSIQPPSSVGVRCTALLGNVYGSWRIIYNIKTGGGMQYIARIPAIIFSDDIVSLLQCSS